MDQVQTDDFTIPVYFYVPDGEGWFRRPGGQCLIAIDVRSQRVLSWVLIPAEQYNALSIRTLLHGLSKSMAFPSACIWNVGFGSGPGLWPAPRCSGDTVSP